MSDQSSQPNDEFTTPPARPSWLARAKSAPVTLAIIAINVAVFALAERAGSTQLSETLLAFGACWRHAVWEGEPWRLFTSMFLHIGIMHLAWNAIFGFRLCAQIENELGRVKFLALYLGSGVAGSALSVIGHNAVSAGASGALFGLIGAQFIRWWQILGSISALWAHPAIKNQILWIGAWFVLGAYSGFDNYAHFGGLLFGAFFSFATCSEIRRRKWLIGISFAILGAFVLAASHPLPVIHKADRKLEEVKKAIERGDPLAVLSLTENEIEYLGDEERRLRARLWAFAALERPTEAMATTNEMVRKFPDAQFAYLSRMAIADQGNDFEQVLADCKRAIEIDPKSTWVWITCAKAEVMLGHFEEALKKAKQAVELAPRNETELRRLEWIMERIKQASE